MKRLILCIVLLVGALFDVSAQDRLHPTHTSTTKSDEIKSFITQMYNNKLYEDYDFLQKHCSAELLKKLQDAYPYDTYGTAYATWLFRSGKQDSKAGADNKTIMLEVKMDGDWFIYTALDMGWEFTNRIKITNKGGEIIIEDVCAVKNRAHQQIHIALNRSCFDNYNIQMEQIEDIIRLRNITSCKQYMRLMLDFYFDAIEASRECDSRMLSDANIWLQTIFTKGCAFLSLLDGINYEKPGVRLNTVLDPSLLFTIARRIYESVVDFNILYIHPQTEPQKEILYNLFMSAGLSERLKNWDENMKSKYPERAQQEEKDIQDCKNAIETNVLWDSLSAHTKMVINNAINARKFRYQFNNQNELVPVKWEMAYELLRVKKDLYETKYSFFSLHSHPSYLALIQFRDAFAPDVRQDLQMAIHSTQCILSFMSIFIVDYMTLFPKVKEMFNGLELPMQFAIGMYEDAMRGENKYK